MVELRWDRDCIPKLYRLRLLYLVVLWVHCLSLRQAHKVPKASPTTASARSDLYGQAVLNACEEIKSRMKTVAEKGTFSSVAKLASAWYFQRIDLSAHGFYATPDIVFVWSIGKGKPFNQRKWFTWKWVVTSTMTEVERGSIRFVFTDVGIWW